MIVISHSLPFYGNQNSMLYVNLNLSTTDITHFIMILFKYLGQIGNCMFMVISAYFLLESKSVKTKKILNLIMSSFLFSVVILFITYLCGASISGKKLIKQFLPITYQGCWFVGCYLFLYIIHPILNKIIYGYEKNQLLRITIVMFTLYSILSTIIGGKGYYYNYLVAFIMIYFVTAYFKIYLQKISKNIKINFIVAIVGISSLFILIFITNIIGIKFNSMSDKMLKWNVFSNPFIIMIAVSIFNIFKKMEFKNLFINSMASLTLYVYMIHENPIVRENFKPFYFENSPFASSLISVLILVIITLLFCFPLSWIYKNIVQEKVSKIWLSIWLHFKYVYLMLEDILLKIK